VHGTNSAIFTEASNKDVIAFRIDVDAFWKRPVELAFWALDEDTTISTDFNGDFIRERDGLFTDA
jgi:hypothetical protein